MTSIVYIFAKLRLQKTLLDKCLKRPVSEHRLTVNILKILKHCWNLQGTSFFIFSLHFQRNRVRKCLP